ncbi:MAG: hypothetical protein D4R90_02865 [Nitrosopumilales archaeon]|nr:MAG: hypothetical protein D4R90_02865 [Nitrosopumilales archaeon]
MTTESVTEMIPEVEYKPVKKIIIHHISKYVSMEKFLTSAIPPNTPSIGWCGGYLISFTNFPESEDVTREVLNGTTHVASVYYCDMPEFKSTIKTQYNQEILVIDQSNELPVVAIAQFLKKRKN